VEVLFGLEGNRWSEVTLAVCHRLSDIYVCKLNDGVT